MISSVLRPMISSGMSSQVSSGGASGVKSIAAETSLDVDPPRSAFFSLFEGSSPGGGAESIVADNEEGFTY